MIGHASSLRLPAGLASSRSGDEGGYGRRNAALTSAASYASERAAARTPTVWSILGLYTVVDFNRLRRAGKDEAIPLAAGIFLDALNVFLLFLRRFARSS